MNGFSIKTKVNTLTGLVLVIVLVATLVPMWRLRVDDERDQKVLVLCLRQIELARTQQLDFKKQVQEWKDTLLRGHNAEDFEKYWGLFLQQERLVQENGKALAGSLTQTSIRAKVDEFLKVHEELGRRYRSALGVFEQSGRLDYRSADRLVLGMDRRPTDLIDAIVGLIANDFDRYLSTHAADLIRQQLYTVGVTLIVFLGLMVASIRVARGITGPINTLAQTVAKVAAGKDYSFRAMRSSRDELGLLTDSFNDMLGQIQARDSALQSAHDSLEQRVQERTHELHTVNKGLRESEDRFRDLFENATDLIQIVSPDGHFLFVNRAWEKALGYTDEDRSNLTVLNIVDESSKEHCTDAFRRLMNGEDVPGMEAVFVGKQGQRIAVEGTVNCRRVDGKPGNTRGIFRDVTARKQAEQTLQQLRDQHALILNSVTEGVHGLDLDGQITFENPASAAMLGYELLELTGRPAHSAIHHTRPDGTLYPPGECPIYATLKDGRGREIKDEVFWRKDGTSFPVEYTSTPLRDEEGRIIGVTVVFTDITERKRAEEVLRASQQLIEGIINAMPVRVFWKDKNLVYLGCNAVFARDAGFANPKDLIGKDDYQMGWRDQAELYRSDDRQVIESGCPKLFIEEPLATPEGTTLTLLTSKIPLLDLKGEISGVLGTYMDITERKRAEAALRLSEERFRIAAETANDVVYEWDLKDALVWLGKIDEMLGYAPGEFPRTLSGWAAAVHPEDLEGAMAAIRAHLDGRAPYAAEYRVRRKDGAYRLWSARGAATRAPDGKPIRWIGSITDITGRRQAENALRESDEKFHQLADNITDAFWIRSPDMREVQYVSPAFERIWGRSVESLYANPHQWSDFILPEDRARVMDAYAALTADAPSLDLEYRIVRPGGEVRWVHVRGYQVRDAAAKPIRHIGIVTDITERKRSEVKLAEASALLEAMLENSPDLIYFKDRASRFVRFSKACYTGFGLTDPEMLRGKTDADFYTVDNAQSVLADEQDVIRTGRPMVGKLEKVNYADGRVAWILTTKMPWRDGRGAIIGTFGISKDITELKKAEAKLATVHRELLATSRQAGMAEIATSVLHNVGNVLNSVNVSATLIADQVRRSEAGKIGKLAALFEEHKADLTGFLTEDPRGQKIPGYLGALAESVTTEQKALVAELEHLRKNVEHIKGVVAMQQSHARTVQVVELTSVTEMVEEALHITADALARHGVEAIRDYQARPTVTTDRHKVMQILINLVRNAKFACAESGRTDKQITVRTTSTDYGVQIAIIDNGVGIPAENLTRIFNHGFTTRKEGHGFGLHSGALAAKELGGSLTVQSDGPGRGATFTLELPIHENSTVQRAG